MLSSVDHEQDLEPQNWFFEVVLSVIHGLEFILFFFLVLVYLCSSASPSCYLGWSVMCVYGIS